MATLDQSTPTPSSPSAPPVSRSWARPMLGLAAVGVLGATGFFGYSMVTGNGQDEQSAKMLLYEVERGDLIVTVQEDGNMESASNVDIKCEVAGGSQIIWIITDGEFVEQGEKIVELDSSALEDQINQQRNTFEKARATLIQAEQDVAVAKISIDEYRLGTFKQEEQDANAQIKISMENLRSAQNSVNHAQRMFRKGYVSKLELETSEFAVERAQLELDSAETAKEVLTNYTYKKILEGLEATADIAEAKLNSERAAFDLEESKLQRLEDQLKKCLIVAPTSGMVVYANESGGRYGRSEGAAIEEGASVRERQSIIKLPDLAKMQVKVNVHESKIENLRPGMRAVVAVQGRELQGTVISIANQPEPTSWFQGNVKEYATYVKIDGQPENLRPGMTAEVEILVANLKDVLLLPVSSVVEKRGGYYCWVKNGSELEKRALTVGMTDDSFVEVKDGVVEGENVLRNPRSVVEEAREVEETEEEDANSKFGSAPEGAVQSPGAGAPNGRPGSDADAGGNREGRGGRDGGGRGGDGGGRGGGGRGSFNIKDMDVDGDGQIVKDELPAERQQMFDFMDSNKDGVIDAAEMDEIQKRIDSSGGRG